RDDLVTGVQTCALPIFIERAIDGRVPVMSLRGDASYDDTPSGAGLLASGVESALAVPLVGASEEVLGVLYAVRRTAAPFAHDDRSEERRGGEEWTVWTL